MFLRLIIRRHPHIIFRALFARLDFRCDYEFDKRLRQKAVLLQQLGGILIHLMNFTF